MYNLVYFTIQSKWDQELKFSLRSFDKYFTELGDVWVFGHLPTSIDPAKVHHVKEQPMVTPGIFTQSGVRRLALHDHPELGEKLIIASDDHYLLKPVTYRDFGPYALQDMSKIETRGRSDWQMKIWRTYDLLVHMGYPTINYESHTPMRIEREKYLQMASLFLNIEKAARHDYESYCVTTAYWNIINDQSEQPRSGQDHRIGFSAINRTRRKSKILQLIKDKTFLFHNDRGLTRALKSVIQDLFPKKSRFEY